MTQKLNCKICNMCRVVIDKPYAEMNEQNIHFCSPECAKKYGDDVIQWLSDIIFNTGESDGQTETENNPQQQEI